jgi:hypothetical protein
MGQESYQFFSGSLGRLAPAEGREGQAKQQRGRAGGEADRFS